MPYLREREAQGQPHQGVWTEDGLSAYTTETSVKYWADELSLLRRVQTPANFTSCLQPIDHHIGMC